MTQGAETAGEAEDQAESQFGVTHADVQLPTDLSWTRARRRAR